MTNKFFINEKKINLYFYLSKIYKFFFLQKAEKIIKENIFLPLEVFGFITNIYFA